MMAGGVDGGGDIWFPSDFLGEGLYHKAAEPRDLWAERLFPADPRGLFRSNLRHHGEIPPPAEETESDEEDYLACLTRRMTHAFLLDDEDHPLSQRYPKVKGMARSPQSTLCDHRIWNGASQVCSPPATPFEQQKNEAWDLLTAAAGEVVRLRLTEEARRQKLHDRGLVAPPEKLVGMPPHKNSRGTGVYYSPLHAQQQLQVERFYQLKQQQLLKQQASTGRPQSRGYAEGLNGRHHVGLSSPAWAPQHPHQHHPSQPHQARLRSGMNAAAAAAALLAGGGARKESTGTGVFLPRRTGNPLEHRKKQAPPAVLPERMGHSPSHYAGDMDVFVAKGNRYFAQQQQKRHQQSRPQPAAAPVRNDNNLRLPAEWTY